MKLRLLVRAPGGKYRNAQKLMRYFPPTFGEYREPFCFSCGIYAHIPHVVKRWINDINYAPIQVYERLRDDPRFVDDIMALNRIPKSELLAEFNRRRMLVKFPKFDPVSYVFVSKYAHLGIVRSVQDSRVAQSSYQRIARLSPWRLDDLLVWRALLEDTEITCGDYGAALERRGRDVFLFLDPPYEIDHGLYDYAFKPRDWYTLAYRLRECKHRFLMTVGDSPIANDLFCTGRYRVIERPYIGADYNGKEGVHHKDLIVCNYDPPIAALECA